MGLALLTASIAGPAPFAQAVSEPEGGAALISPTEPIEVLPCYGSTSTVRGTINTPKGFELPVGSTAAQELLEGKTIMLYGNNGDVYIDDQGEHDGKGQGGLPYCGARVLDDGEIEVGWRFCTDEGKRGCAELPPSSEWQVDPDEPLSNEQKLQISHLLLAPVLDTKRDRAKTQLQVWCVSEDVKEGSVNTEAKQYFNRYDFGGAANSSDLEVRPLSDDEARCQFLPELDADPMLTLSGPQGELSAGETAEFVLDTNVTTPIKISSDGSAPLTLCPASQEGVTFNGTVLELSAPGRVSICTTSPGTGTVTVAADTGDLPLVGELGLLWNGDQGCQVFADYVEGSRIRIERSAEASFRGSGTFTIDKEFDGVSASESDLDDVSIEILAEVVGGPTLPSGVPNQSTLVLNQANGFRATGATYPDGTNLRLSEKSVTGLPPALDHVGGSWQVNGEPFLGDSADIVIGDDTSVAVTLINRLAPVLGTFEVRKSFVLDDGSTVPPAGTEVAVRWWVKGTDENTGEIILLNESNDFTAMPGVSPGSPTVFPLGTTILLEEVSQDLPEGVSNEIDWGSNTDLSYTGAGNRGVLTIAEAWDPDSHTPGGSTSASEVTLTNGIAIDRGSLTVAKQVRLQGPGGAAPELGTGALDDVEISVTASWEHPDPVMNVSGNNVLLLNASNEWQTGLGVDLPAGTVVVLEEYEIFSSDPSIAWEATPEWTCTTCSPPFENEATDRQTITITGVGSGVPIDDVAVTLTNPFRVLQGSFSVEKLVSGDIDRNDGRLSEIEFTVDWQSNDPENSSGSFALSSPDWSGAPTDASGDPIQFPLGTQVTLQEVTPPPVLGGEWIDDIQWSIGGDGSDAAIIIAEEDGATGPAAELKLTNFLELHEGSFSIAKFVHSIGDVGLDDGGFEVTYRSLEKEPYYEGTLTVQNGEEAFSGLFPAGTELVLEEAVPVTPSGATGWEKPLFTDSEGNTLEAPVVITIGDGTDLRVDLINTTIEPTPPVPPGSPVTPRPALPLTGADQAAIWVSAAALVLLLGGASLLALQRRRQES